MKKEDGYREGLIICSDRFLQMMKETGIVAGPSYYDRGTGKLYTSPMRPEDIKKAEEWYKSHPET